jgi:hypothetical protein
MQRVNEILSHVESDLIPVEVDELLHAQFKNLVSGKLEIPHTADSLERDAL